MFNNRRVLVTGGSHLCERLLGRGDEVLCVDNFFTATRPNVSGLMLNCRFELVRHDVCFPLYVEVDKIYNLACPASPIHYQFDPVQTTKTSVHGAINMLGLAKRVPAMTRASAVLKLCSSITTASTSCNQGGANLQYTRPADAPQRRPCGIEFYRSGIANQ